MDEDHKSISMVEAYHESGANPERSRGVWNYFVFALAIALIRYLLQG